MSSIAALPSTMQGGRLFSVAEFPIATENTTHSHEQQPALDEQSDDQRAYAEFTEALRRELSANWIGGYCQMPDAVRNDPDLGNSAKLVYEQLLSYMWLKTDRCWPSQTTIAEALGISRRTVIRACEELYQRGHIEKWRRGLCRTNVYFVNPISFARSFRRTHREEPSVAVLAADNQARRVDISQLPPAPDPALEHMLQSMCQNDTSGSDTMSHQEVSECHPKHTKSNHIQGKHTLDSSRSARGAEPKKEEFYTRPETIRRDEDITTETGTREPEPATQEPKPENRNTVASQERPAAPPCPIYVETYLARLSERFNDLQPKASRTRAAKLYHRARAAGCLDEYEFVGSTDSPEPYWIAAAEAATVAKLQRPGEAGITKVVKGRKVAMPYFFSCLEGLVGKAEQERAAYDAVIQDLQSQAQAEQLAPEPEAQEPTYQPEQECPRQDDTEAQEPEPTTAPAPSQEPEAQEAEQEAPHQEPEAQEQPYQGGYTVEYQPSQESQRVDLREINPVAADVLARIRARRRGSA